MGELLGHLPPDAMEGFEADAEKEQHGVDHDRAMDELEEQLSTKEAIAELRELMEEAQRARPQYEGQMREESGVSLQRIRDSKLRKPVLFAMLGLLGVGVTDQARGMAQELADGPPTGIELVDSMVQGIEGEMTERTVASFNTHFQEAAQDLRQSKSLTAEFEQEDISKMAESLESFSGDDFFGFMADEMQMDVDDIARSWDLEGVHIYSSQDMSPDAFTKMVIQEADLTVQDAGVHIGELADLATTAQIDGGFHFEGHIFVNASVVKASGVDLALGMQNVLFHELHHLPQEADYDDKAMAIWQEGLIELRADAYAAHTNEISVADADVLSGYTGGGRAGIELLSAALGDDAYVLNQVLITGDWNAGGDRLNELYPGEFDDWSKTVRFDAETEVTPDRFESSIQTTRDLNEQIEFENVREQRQALQPLVAMMDFAAQHPEYVEAANKNLSEGAGQISVFNSGGVAGIALAHSRTETGFASGLITVDTPSGTETIMLSQYVKDKEVIILRWGMVQCLLISTIWQH